MDATTTITVDKPLLAQTVIISKQQSEPAAVNLALKEFVQRHVADYVIDAFGTIEYDENYDYKAARNR
ncbi:MAG: type II toxin-antitoxin system VapB family antitoxin [Treponema sp.]|nr:type II toxin-antitoxin system VapB family antitoxin [Treponema sp.]